MHLAKIACSNIAASTRMQRQHADHNKVENLQIESSSCVPLTPTHPRLTTKSALTCIYCCDSSQTALLHHCTLKTTCQGAQAKQRMLDRLWVALSTNCVAAPQLLGPSQCCQPKYCFTNILTTERCRRHTNAEKQSCLIKLEHAC